MATTRTRQEFDFLQSKDPTREMRLLIRLMYLIEEGDLYTALRLVAYKSNHKYLARILGAVFFRYECLPEEELKMKAYEKLRNLVTNICAGIWNIDGDLGQNRDYQSVATRLFTNQGFRAP